MCSVGAESDRSSRVSGPDSAPPEAPSSILGRPLDAGVATPGLAAWIDRLRRRDEHAADRHPYRIVLEERESPEADGKAFLGWDALEPSRVPRARLERVTLLERGGRGLDDARRTDGEGDAADGSPLRPPVPRDAVRALWEATGVPLTSTARRTLAARVADLTSSPSFARLRLGRTPLPDPAAIG